MAPGIGRCRETAGEVRRPCPVPWTPRGGRESHPAVSATLRAMKERGVYAYTKWNMIMLAPPFIITEAELDEGLEVIDAALAVADEQVART